MTLFICFFKLIWTYQQVSTTFCLLAGWDVSSPGICSRDFCDLDSGKLKRLCLSGDLHLWTPPFLIAIPRTGSYKDCQWIICRGKGVILRKISWFDWIASLGQSCIHLAWIHPIRFWWFMCDWVCSWQGGASLMMWRGLQTKRSIRSGSNVMSPAILQPTMEGRIRRRSIHRRSPANRYTFSCKKSCFVWRLSSAPGWLAFWLVQPLCFL